MCVLRHCQYKKEEGGNYIEREQNDLLQEVPCPCDKAESFVH